MPAGPRRVERAETGLTTAHHQQLQISILPSSTLFVAGQAVHGIVELACSSSRLRLADVSLELVGHEGLPLFQNLMFVDKLVDAVSRVCRTHFAGSHGHADFPQGSRLLSIATYTSEQRSGCRPALSCRILGRQARQD